MPRRRRPQGGPNGALPEGPVAPVGAPAQPVTVAPGQPYGEASVQRQAQQAMPLPGAPAAGGIPDAIAAAAAHPPPPTNLLAMPTARPDEPVTHGLAGGPGAGPEALNMAAPRTRVADTLSQLADMLGDHSLAELARDAATRNI